MIAAIYMASVFGAIGLYLMMPRRGYTPWRLGMLLGAAALGGGWLYLSRYLPELTGLPTAAIGYYYLFSAIAIGAATRVITHTRPVYAALWFVMVVLASSGLFLTLDAEFMAFAMLIIYGGAILVTYLFVIMLAASSSDEGDTGHACDREPREPGVAVIAGFMLLALLLSVFVQQSTQGRSVPHNPAATARSDMQTKAQILPTRAIDRLRDKSTGTISLVNANPRQLENVEKIGLELFERHPLGLELAGVILLMALIGAVVIATRQVPEGSEVSEISGNSESDVSQATQPG